MRRFIRSTWDDAATDYKVLERCFAEDRVIVTGNARDFRKLINTVELHSGLIILPAIDREGTWQLLQKVIEYLSTRGDPMQVMVTSPSIRCSGTPVSGGTSFVSSVLPALDQHRPQDELPAESFDGMMAPS